MKSGVSIQVLTPIAAAVGGVLQAMRIGGLAEASSTIDLLGVSLLSVAAGGGVLMMRMRRDDSKRFAETMSHASDGDVLRPVDWPNDHLSPIVGVVNDALTRANEIVAEAADEARHVAVELKIAAAARRHAEGVISSIADAVIVTDAFDEIVLLNRSAMELFGIAEDVTRMPIDKVAPMPELVELIRSNRQGGSHVRRTEEMQLAVDGELRDFVVTQVCVGDGRESADGVDQHSAKDFGVVTVLHDVTRVMQMQKAKNEFVSGVTHELRTPVASIKAYAEMLADGDVVDEKMQAESYDIILSEAERLSNLIDNILNISRIESGLVPIERKPVSPVLVAEKALDVIEPQATLKNIAIKRQMLPSMHQVIADEDLLYQVMLNLLSNAVKYTPEGGSVTLSIEIDDATGQIATSIIDTGAGIPADDLPRVFEKFYRVKQNNQMAKGTGLGLPLVKRVIEVDHDGELIAESEVGAGSTFGFRLPMVGSQKGDLPRAVRGVSGAVSSSTPPGTAASRQAA